MTDVATTPERKTLSPFEGREVLSAAIEIPNAAGGLREAMQIDPQEFHHGDKRYVVLELDCTKVRFDPVKDTAGLRRVHVFNAAAATFVDEDLVRTHLDEQAKRIEAARIADEQAKGIQRLYDENGEPATSPPADDGEEEDQTIVLERQHSQGVHADGLREGCPMCEAEAEAQAAEEADKTTPIENGRPRGKGGKPRGRTAKRG